ncbi:hypothetical protein V6N13_059131 [Hibiscus sabdariffa]
MLPSCSTYCMAVFGSKGRLHDVAYLGLASKGDMFGDLEGWWDSPRRARPIINVGRCRPIGVLKFRVAGLGHANQYGCGGVLVAENGEIKVVFFGPSEYQVLLASWEVSSWCRSGLFAAFKDDGLLTGSMKEV